MKVSNLALVNIMFTSLPKHAIALKCGINFVTQDCLGDTDPRYDTDISYDLEEGDAFWKTREGLYVGNQCEYGGDGIPRNKQYLPRLGPESGAGTWNFCDVKVMTNITVDGTRMSTHSWLIVKHNSDSKGGDRQLPGLIVPSNTFATSTFDKNGEAKIFASALRYNKNFTISENPSKLTPVGGKAFLGLGTSKDLGGGNVYQSLYCVDSECNKSNSYIESYFNFLTTQENIETTEATEEVEWFQRASMEKVDKSTWMAEWEKSFTEYAVTPSDQAIPGFKRDAFIQMFDPTTDESAPECNTGACPSEDDWIKFDPNFNQSPYVEPDGTVTGGFIALITILSVLVASTIFYIVYTRGVEARERRVKVAVLKSIAATMTIKSIKKLTPGNLEEMFQKIDVDGNGNLDKSEVKGLVEEAGVVDMSGRDYDILFASIDLDGNGSLDFAEFCAFFTSISAADADSFKDP